MLYLRFIVLTLLCCTRAAAQNDSLAKGMYAIPAGSYESFRTSGPVRALVDTMGKYKVVALGEGTHGTAEFYRYRYWLTRMLVEEKGFDMVAFENDYGDTWFLNRGLDSDASLDSLLRAHALSIWQNDEIKELLTWARLHNRQHASKVRVGGLDHVMVEVDVDMLEVLLKDHLTGPLQASLDTLRESAAYIDRAWAAMNGNSGKWARDSASLKGYKGYVIAERLKKDLPPAVRDEGLLALANLQQAFSPFYAGGPSRDSSMARYVSALDAQHNTKIIIWAHNAHIAKKTFAYNNDHVGGMGAHLMKMYPGNYFALGTGTAYGSYAATTDRFDTRSNPMAAYQLKKPVPGSWESGWARLNVGACYIVPAVYNAERLAKPLRFVGYRPESGKKSYAVTNISDLFDVFLFIRDTNAAHFFR